MTRSGSRRMASDRKLLYEKMAIAARSAAGEFAMRSNSAGDSSRNRPRNRAAEGRSGDEASSSSIRSAASMPSGHLGEDLDRIARPDRSRRQHTGVKSAHTPARRRRIERFHLAVVNLLLDGGSVDVELQTRHARGR